MGIYVYALNTKVRRMSNVDIGVMEFRYKEGWGDNKCYNQTCRRRVDHFDNVGLPDFFIMGKPMEGEGVYSFTSKTGREVGACFSDGGDVFNRVGTMRKVGRSWTIAWNEGFQYFKDVNRCVV